MVRSCAVCRIQRGSRNHRKFSPQSIDHVIGANISQGSQKWGVLHWPRCSSGFSMMKNRPWLVGVSAREPHHRFDRRILHHNLTILFHLAAHGMEMKCPVPPDTEPMKPSRILLREKALGHHDVEVHAQAGHENRHEQSHRLMRQHPRAPAIRCQQAVEGPFTGTIEYVMVCPSRPGAGIWRTSSA